MQSQILITIVLVCFFYIKFNADICTINDKTVSTQNKRTTKVLLKGGGFELKINTKFLRFESQFKN